MAVSPTRRIVIESAPTDPVNLSMGAQNLPSPVPAESEGRPEREPQWSLGAGITGAFTSLEFLSPYSVDVMPPDTSLGALVLFERRLGRTAHLMLEPDVFYRELSFDDVVEEKIQEGAVDVHAGVRWVANPGARVEIGMGHLVAAGYWRLTNSGTRYRRGNETVDSGDYLADTTTNEYRIGLVNTFIAEVELVDRLWLRASAALVRLVYATGDFEARYEDGLIEEDDASAAFIGFRPSGSITVRLAF